MSALKAFIHKVRGRIILRSWTSAFTEFSEVRLALLTVASCLRWKKLASPRSE